MQRPADTGSHAHQTRDYGAETPTGTSRKSCSVIGELLEAPCAQLCQLKLQGDPIVVVVGEEGPTILWYLLPRAKQTPTVNIREKSLRLLKGDGNTNHFEIHQRVLFCSVLLTRLNLRVN